MKKNSKKRGKLNRGKNIDIMDLISKNDINGIIKNLHMIPLDKPINIDMYLIHYAVMLNSIDLLKAILKENTIWDYPDYNRNTIAHLAAKNGYCEILDFLSKKFNNKILEVKNINGNNILFALIENPHCFDNIKNLNIKKYINEKNINGDTPLTRTIDLLALLINIKFNKTANNTYRQIEPKQITRKYDDKHPLLKTIKILLDNGANPDISVAEPPIVVAARCNALDLVEILLKYKCDVNIGDKAGKTALGWAIYNNNMEMIKLLMKNKAEIDTYTILGDSYLPIVGINFGNDEIIKYILEQKINYEFTDYNHNTMAHIVLLNYSEYPVNIIKTLLSNTNNYNKSNLDGNSLSHLVCTLNIELLENLKDILINKRMNLYLKNKEGKTGFDYIDNDEKKKVIILIIKNSLERQLKDSKLVKPKYYEDMDDLINNKKITCLYTNEEIDNDKLENNIKLIEYPYANFNLFKNWFFDDLIMFGIILNRNSEYMTIPIIEREELMGIDKYKRTTDNDSSNFKITMINQHYTFMMYYFPEIITSVILWFNKDNYVFTEYHETAFLKAMDRNQRFIVIMLGLFIHEQGSGHANILIYDKKLNVMERFDSEGVIYLNMLDDLDVFLRNKFKKLVNREGFKYISPKDYGIINSFQKLSDEINTLKRKTGDVKGFCQAWVFWYIEMRILNKDIQPIKLVDKLLSRLIKMNNSSILEYIRNYANDLRKKVYNFMMESNIDAKIINNETYPEPVYKIMADSSIKMFRNSI